jgi:phosphohistidine phosphatase SixA
MNEPLPEVYLGRHGETDWSLTGRHTGRTDLPLTECGENEARKLRGRLEGITFNEVLVSPLQRARRTCELAGILGDGHVELSLAFQSVAEVVMSDGEVGVVAKCLAVLGDGQVELSLACQADAEVRSS